jgi:PadR family transcriptional regulator PadR
VNAEALKGHLELLVLTVVSAGPIHGYGVIDGLKTRSDGTFDLAEGTVYPVLHRLERAGLLHHEWSEASGRRRKLYALTAHGEAKLAERREGWREFVEAVESVLRRNPWPQTA